MLESMEEMPVQILEVRPEADERGGAITLAVTAGASQALHTALAEQLDRRRAEPLDEVAAVLELRDATALVERFAPLAAAGAHAVVKLSPDELRGCLLGLTDYADRMDLDSFQPLAVRERLEILRQISPVLWDANAAVTTPPPAPIPE